MGKLDGRTAVIVGGARGIGAAIARLFAAEGAKIAVVDLEKMKSELDAVARELSENGRQAAAVTADCSDARQVDEMMNGVVRLWGRIDILVNSAGLRGPLVPVEDITEAE
jgi:NAD(P)-dependent dehydrogenase (short-subunit alcohol dehydrogenase family)